MIEDLSRPTWHSLLRIISRHGFYLRHLDIEATGELEPFFSNKGIFSVLAQSTPNLECLRIDGLSVGLDSHTEHLVHNCRKIRAITIDYCYGITMASFLTIWNNLDNLEFIGFAGVIGALHQTAYLKHRPTVKTIRFVDCDVSDSLVW